jgi:hypothetical protein
MTTPALLAQSVEHFHGKEKVVGSIPTEGSTYLAAAYAAALTPALHKSGELAGTQVV